MTKEKKTPRGRSPAPWTRWEVQAYILECYEGVEVVEGPSGVPKPARTFMWADETGEVWIGNSAAFAEHLAQRFKYDPLPYDYVSINSLLIKAGERLLDKQARTPTVSPKRQGPLVPKKERAR